jgi:hypothetical protein
VCDANCKIMAFSCKHSGATNDLIAFETSNLRALNESLPFPFHFNGDGAYRSTETMMVTFGGGAGLHITDPAKDSFNFFHSQLRITIERCFGIFIQRFGIFWKELMFPIDFIVEIVHCCIRLHNLCVDFRLNSSFNDHADVEMMVNLELNRAPDWTRDVHELDNTLRDDILKTILDNEYFHRRNIQ